MSPRIVEVRRDILEEERPARARVAGGFRRRRASSSRAWSPARAPARRRCWRNAPPPAAVAPRRRAGRRPGDRERRQAAGAHGRAGPADRHRHGLPPGSRHGRAALEDGTSTSSTSVHRERRQPGVPGQLRPRRGPRVVLLSTTEGEDKPLKYPPMFHSATSPIITKIDLAGGHRIRPRAAMTRNIQAVRPGLEVLETSARNRPRDGAVVREARVPLGGAALTGRG